MLLYTSLHSGAEGSCSDCLSCRHVIELRLLEERDRVNMSIDEFDIFIIFIISKYLVDRVITGLAILG
jgi:hypothetical protein